MKPIISTLRTLLCVVLLGVSLCVSANDWLERADNFSAYSLGQGKVHFKILIYANGAWNNYWVEDHSGNESRAYYQIKDGDNWQDPIDIVHFRTTNDKCSDRGAAKGWVKFKVRSGMILTTNEYDGVKRQYSSSDDIKLRYYSSILKNNFISKETFLFQNDEQKGSYPEPYTPEFIVEE